jgi:hypothetical protein
VIIYHNSNYSYFFIIKGRGDLYRKNRAKTSFIYQKKRGKKGKERRREGKKYYRRVLISNFCRD